MSIKIPMHDDLADLYEQKSTRSTAGTTVKSRRDLAGKKPPKGTDRRFKHGEARSRQYNTNVTQEIHDLVADLLDEFDLTKAEFTERAIRLYAESLRKNGHA